MGQECACAEGVPGVAEPGLRHRAPTEHQVGTPRLHRLGASQFNVTDYLFIYPLGLDSLFKVSNHYTLKNHVKKNGEKKNFCGLLG